MRSWWMVVVLPLVALAGCQKPAEKAPEKAVAVALPPVKVETVPVETRPMPRYLTLTGTVLADKQSEVAANVVGRVTATNVERGQAVRRGDVLAVVDSRAAGFSATAAMAQSQAADTQVELAKQDCARADTLFSQGAISKAEHDRLKTQCSAQLFQATAARANADLAGKLAGDTVIRAPIDGVVGERYVNVGEYVQPASRVASLYAVNPVRVSLSVPEPAVGQVKVGLPVDVRVAAWPDRVFPATLKYLGPALRPLTRDLIVEAEAENTDLALRPGMFATVLVLVGESAQPTVPQDAIRTDGMVKRLYLAKEGQAFEVVVRTGVSKDGRVAVQEALSEKDRVIVRPPPGLRDGAAIQ